MCDCVSCVTSHEHEESCDITWAWRVMWHHMSMKSHETSHEHEVSCDITWAWRVMWHHMSMKSVVACASDAWLTTLWQASKSKVFPRKKIQNVFFFAAGAGASEEEEEEDSGSARTLVSVCVCVCVCVFCVCVCVTVCVCVWESSSTVARWEGWQGTCPLHTEAVKKRSLIFLLSSLEVPVCVWYTIQSIIRLTYVVPSHTSIVWVCI